MAEIISTTLEWSQEDAMKYFLQPLFVSNNDLSHFDVISDISGASIVLDKYSALKDVTKSQSAACFNADDTESSNSNVTLTLDRLEVEHAQSAFSLFNHIKSQLMKKGVSRNDLSGTLIMQIVSELLLGGINRDFSTILWWSQKASGVGTQGLSNGVWEACSAIPAAQKVTATGVAITDLASLMDARTNELAGSVQKIFCSRAFADTYKSELQAAGTHTAAYMDLQTGIEKLQYNGIEMEVKYDWDVNITAYAATLPTGSPSAAYGAMLVAKDAIAVGTDNDLQGVEMWYDKNCKENRFRMNYSFGCALKDDSLVATIG